LCLTLRTATLSRTTADRERGVWEDEGGGCGRTRAGGVGGGSSQALKERTEARADGQIDEIPQGGDGDDVLFERELTESHLTLRCRTSSAPTAANAFWRPYESIHIWKCNLHMTVGTVDIVDMRTHTNCLLQT
jgi:hypothetical protein